LQTAKDKNEMVETPAGFDKYGHFLDAVEGKCASVADARCGRQVVAITEKALESALRGQVAAL